MEQVYDCLEVLKSLSHDQKQKFFDGSLKDSNFSTNQNISLNIFGEIAEAFASSNRNIAIKNMLIKINSDMSDAVNASSLVKNITQK